MSSERSTPIGTPVVLAPGRIVLVGEYAALADGSTVEAAFGCYARAQFIPAKDSNVGMTLVAEIVEQIKIELAELAPALPPGTVLLTNEDFRALGAAVAGMGGSAAMAVATVGAVLESMGLALESRKPLVFRIADAARRRVQGYRGSGSDTAAAAYGGLIRTRCAVTGQRQPSPMAPPAGLHLVVFAAGPSRPPGEIARALQHFASKDPAAYLEAVARLRELSQRFLDEVASGQATGAITAAGKYGEVLQDLCDEAAASIMNPAFSRAAGLARELGGVAKPTGAGNGEVGVALFATPEACQYFRKACTAPLVALAGDLDPAGVRCEFPDNAVMADLDERDSAEVPEPEPDEFDMPTVKTSLPIATSLREEGTAPNPGKDESVAHDEPVAHAMAREAHRERPARRSRWPYFVFIGMLLGLGVGYEIHRLHPVPVPPSLLPPAPPGMLPSVLDAAAMDAEAVSLPGPTTTLSATQSATQTATQVPPAAPSVEPPPKRRRPSRSPRHRPHRTPTRRLAPEEF